MENNTVESYNTFVDYALELLKKAKILDDTATYISFSIDEQKYIFNKLDTDKEYSSEEVQRKYHELLGFVNMWKDIINLLDRINEFKKAPSMMSKQESEIFILEESICDNFYQITDLSSYEEEYSRLVKILQQLDVVYGENK